SRLIRVAACDSPAFAHYKPGPAGGHVPWSLIVLELAGDGIAAMTYFLDTQALFPRFGLPLALP
ncbi:MAG TPA: RNA polymerase subunit sigma-70, partial [Nannocystis sp.]